MKNLILLSLLIFGTASAQSPSPDTEVAAKSFSLSTGKFIVGRRAEKYYERLQNARWGDKDVASKTCADVSYSSGETMPIGLSDKLSYALHTRYFGGRCVVDCHDFGKPLPITCLKIAAGDGTFQYQCALFMGAWGTQKEFVNRPEVQKIMSCADRHRHGY